MLIQIAHNAVNAKLVNADKEVKLAVQAILSYAVAGSEHMQAFNSGMWDGRSSFFEFDTATFPRGFVKLVENRLKKQGYQVSIIKKPFPQPLGDAFPIVDNFPEEERYDYQREVVKRLEAYGQIIAQVATGGGKSRIAKLCTSRIGRKTLFLTTRGVLMYQMYDSFKEINKNTAILGDGNLEVGEITCGMVQTIASHLEKTTIRQEFDKIVTNLVKKFDNQREELITKLRKEKAKPEVVAAALKKLEEQQDRERPTEKDAKLDAKKRFEVQEKRRNIMLKTLESFEFIILEEAHESSGNSYYEILRHCVNAHYRLALTATPFMKDSEEANMRLMASSGHVAIKVSEKMLIDRGILAKPYFKYVNLPQEKKHKKLFKSTPWQNAYKFGITEAEFRNKTIVAECIRAKSYGLSTMVLVQHKAHGQTIKDLLVKYGLRATYIFGEDKQDERKRAIKSLKDGDIDVLVGSTILDVGVDVPAVGLVVLAGGGKAEVALRQRIGRGLRAKKLGPNVAFIIDFADDFNNHLKEHYLTRRAIVENTEGFGENIVTDFDYERCGFKKVA